MALRRPRVVIIDDDARVASILADLVRTMGMPQCSVETASNGEAGLAAVRRERPDLVLLDLRMPGIDGVEVLKRIRDIDAGIAVIVITGAGDLADASAALASGAQACLQKPVDLQQFKQVVSDVLDRSQSPGQ